MQLLLEYKNKLIDLVYFKYGSILLGIGKLLGRDKTLF